jgi:hypothetical protein
VTRPGPGRRHVLRSRTWNVVGALALLGFAGLCGALGFYDDPGAADHEIGLVIWGTGAAVCLAGAVRVLGVGVIATSKGLTVRELLHTTKLPWAWLSRVAVQPNRQVLTGGPTLYNPTIHYVEPRQGPRTVTVTALGAHRPEVAQGWADELNALIRRHKTAPGKGGRA